MLFSDIFHGNVFHYFSQSFLIKTIKAFPFLYSMVFFCSQICFSPSIFTVFVHGLVFLVRESIVPHGLCPFRLFDFLGFALLFALYYISQHCMDLLSSLVSLQFMCCVQGKYMKWICISTSFKNQPICVYITLSIWLRAPTPSSLSFLPSASSLFFFCSRFHYSD